MSAEYGTLCPHTPSLVKPEWTARWTIGTTSKLEKKGKTYAGKYRVEGGIITVTYDAGGGGDKSAQVDNSEPERLAKLLLSELVAELRK
jgi:hypothetical protein